MRVAQCRHRLKNLPNGIAFGMFAGVRERVRALMESLLLTRFVRPEPEDYDALRQRFETTCAFWRSHPLAETVHPSFALSAR
jgi:hypothetical protein